MDIRELIIQTRDFYYESLDGIIENVEPCDADDLETVNKIMAGLVDTYKAIELYNSVAKMMNGGKEDSRERIPY